MVACDLFAVFAHGKSVFIHHAEFCLSIKILTRPMHVN